MQALIATLDAALFTSVSTLLVVLQHGAIIRRAYNGPEVNALLEGEAFTLVFLDSTMSGYGREFSANALAPWYPAAQFFVLGGTVGLRLDSVLTQIPDPNAASMNAGNDTSIRADLMQAVDLIQHRGKAGPNLTVRQLDVLRLVREGKSTKEIARHLSLAVPTVKTHLAALYRQLGVRNRVEAAMTQATPTPQPARFGAAPRHAQTARLGILRAVG